jgi:hypothetical protein
MITSHHKIEKKEAGDTWGDFVVGEVLVRVHLGTQGRELEDVLEPQENTRVWEPPLM